jgi:predicted nucleotidyltransferase
VKTIQPGLLEEAVERLKSEFQPEQIWLFGSHAWGTPTEDSDVDLMVIVPSSDERPIRRMQRAQRCLRGIGFAKDVLVNTRPEFDWFFAVFGGIVMARSAMCDKNSFVNPVGIEKPMASPQTSFGTPPKTAKNHFIECNQLLCNDLQINIKFII